MTMPPPPPLRLHLDPDELAHNWRWLQNRNPGAACGAAVKADGYGLGAMEVMRHLRRAGCHDFFVATWAEALALVPYLDGAGLSVLHGVREEDMAVARACPARPVLNSASQIARWRDAGGGPCDIMVDTGMNRLGIRADEIGMANLEGLAIDICMSHLARADEDSEMNARQADAFERVMAMVPARRYSLANSAGVMLGARFAHDLVRPGLALYGGVPRREGEGHIRQVVRPQAQILQRRMVPAGESVGYGATWQAMADTPVAILNIGYADGYFRALGTGGYATTCDGQDCPLVGRVSMDLVAVALPAGGGHKEGDWLALAFDLPAAERTSGLSQYELLTSLGHRFERRWL